VAEVGLTVTATVATTVTVAVAMAPGFTVLVAWIVTVPLGRTPGAVYVQVVEEAAHAGLNEPFPAPKTVQVTVVVGVPVTVAVNDCWPLKEIVAIVGLTLTTTGMGFTVTAAGALTTMGLAIVVAVTDTMSGMVMFMGAL
jgi:hypothetical protein